MDDARLSPGAARYLEQALAADARRRLHLERMRRCRFDTIAVHGLYGMDEALGHNLGAIIEPLHLSCSQTYRDADEMEAAFAGHTPTRHYARIANPTIDHFESTLALLEGYGFAGEVSACATSSGLSAIASATDPFLAHDPARPKMNFVSTRQVYGGTFQQFSLRKANDRGIEARWIDDPADMAAWESRIDDETRFVYGELPSNPGQTFFDIEAVAAIAHRYGAPLIVDSTVASPALLRPLCHGADIVVQSVTKSLTSSGLGVAGAVIARRGIECRIGPAALRDDFAFYLKSVPNRDNGQNLSPFNALMSLADMRTLRSRMDMFSRNTETVARFLESHPGVARVDYLGLESHPFHQLASRYLWLVDAEHDPWYGRPVNRYGHLMAFRVRGGKRAARAMFDRLQRIWRATDLGRIKSVATLPAISTHAGQDGSERLRIGVPDDMVRLCVGGEHPDDVIADLDQALAGAASPSTSADDRSGQGNDR